MAHWWHEPPGMPRKHCRGLFGVFRLLLPHNDKRRFGLSLRLLIEHIVEALGVGRDSSSAHEVRIA
jgi:hypothetical protein